MRVSSSLIGRGASAEFRVRVDSVELWYREHLAAVFDRDVLRDCLREPAGELGVDEATLSIDWLIDVHGRIALTLPDVNAWALSPTELNALYLRVVTLHERDHRRDAAPTTSVNTDHQPHGTTPRVQRRLRRAPRPEGCPRFLVELAQSEYTADSCQLGSLVGQLAETDPEARALIAAGFDQWSATIEEGLRSLQADGELQSDIDPGDLAITLLATLEGGLLLAQVLGSSRPFEIAIDTLLALAIQT